MPSARQKKEQQEPLGIVISNGRPPGEPPRLSAYVYSVEDETSGEPIGIESEPVEVKAA